MSDLRVSAASAGPSPGASVGISEEIIRELVHTFYANIREDDVLGPIFDAKVADWPTHLETMCSFWSSVVLTTGRYKGRPMPVHARIAGIGSGHFARWLQLFRHTAHEVCEEAAADLFIDRAERIAQSLQAGIAVHRESLAALQEEQARTEQARGEPS